MNESFADGGAIRCQSANVGGLQRILRYSGVLARVPARCHPFILVCPPEKCSSIEFEAHRRSVLRHARGALLNAPRRYLSTAYGSRGTRRSPVFNGARSGAHLAMPMVDLRQPTAATQRQIAGGRDQRPPTPARSSKRGGLQYVPPNA